MQWRLRGRVGIIGLPPLIARIHVRYPLVAAERPAHNYEQDVVHFAVQDSAARGKGEAHLVFPVLGIGVVNVASVATIMKAGGKVHLLEGMDVHVQPIAVGARGQGHERPRQLLGIFVGIAGKVRVVPRKRGAVYDAVVLHERKLKSACMHFLVDGGAASGQQQQGKKSYVFHVNGPLIATHYTTQHPMCRR